MRQLASTRPPITCVNSLAAFPSRPGAETRSPILHISVILSVQDQFTSCCWPGTYCLNSLLRMFPTCCSILAVLSLLASVGANTPIYFGFVATDDTTSAELIPSLDIALSTINNSSSVLPGYQLSYVPWISECDRTTSLNGFLGHMLERCNGSTKGPTILGVVGCGCTVADFSVAELVHYWNISQISYGASSLEMKDRQRFPNYFLLHSVENWGRALQAVLSAFDWRRLAVLTDNSTRFIEVDEVIQSLFDSSDLNVTQKRIMNGSNIQAELDSLDNDYRVIFINTYSEAARDILCYANKRGMVFPRYAWIVYGWYSSDWWVTSQTSDCSDEDIGRFLDDSRVLALHPYQTEEEQIIGGITRSEYYSLYRAAQEASKVSFVPESPLIYDSVWTLALALNATIANQIPVSNSCSSGLPLEDFSYSSANLGSEIREAVSRTSFSGASGTVMFDQNGRRQQVFTSLLQYRNGTTVEVGRVNVSSDREEYSLTYTASESQSTVFPGTIPMDGTPVKVIVTFDAWIVGVCYPLAIIGLIFTFICFFFNTAFKNRRIVRLTSPNMNYFIILGAAVCLCAIFVHLIRSTDPEVHRIRCYLQVWLLTLGYTIAFGAVIAKMYRVIHIFKNPSPKKTKLKDWKLSIIVLIVTGLGLALLLVQLIVPSFRFEPHLEVNRENPSGVNELGITEIYCSWRCVGGDPVAYYYQIIYYVVILVIFGIALVVALLSHSVKMKVLNDSRWIAAIVYVGVPIVILFFALTFVLAPWLHLSGAIYCIGLFVASSIFLGFIFIPKMVAFARDPKGQNIFARGGTFTESTIDTGDKKPRRRPTLVTIDTPMSPTTPSGIGGSVSFSNKFGGSVTTKKNEQ